MAKIKPVKFCQVKILIGEFFFTRVKVKEVAAAKVKLTVDHLLYGFATLFAGSAALWTAP